MSSSNILDNIPHRMPAELTKTLLRDAKFRIERIVSHGHASPEDFWYDQDTEEWVMLVQGAARLAFEDGVVEMRAGDYLHIPAHKRHRVDWTDAQQPTIWLAVFWATG